MAVVLRVAELLLELGVSTAKVGIAETLPQPRRGAHASPPPIRRMESGEGEPGFVPEEDQIRLDRQAFLHDPLDVIDDAVERAIGEQHELDAVELACASELEQSLLDRPDRHRPIHRILVERIRVQVYDVGAREYHAVVM